MQPICWDRHLSYTFICFCAERDECLSNPCKNGGTCQDRLNGYRCICDIGWLGTDCTEGKVFRYIYCCC